jgi:hypothetical protein
MGVEPSGIFEKFALKTLDVREWHSREPAALSGNLP